jgi:ABC-type branched-subunit amino acid transport system permease subunit
MESRMARIVIIGGLDSILDALIGAILVRVLESLAAGYVDPVVAWAPHGGRRTPTTSAPA